MFETIVWATDGSPAATQALALVEELARVHHSKIVALHVHEIRPEDAGGEDDLRVRIRDQVAGLRRSGFDVDFEVLDGHVGVPDLIASAARARGADVIVVGTHGKRGFGTVLVGDVSRRLLQIARCPVLAVPPPRAPAADAPDDELVGTA